MLFRLMEIIGLKLLYPLLLLQTRLQSPTKCRLSCVSKLPESSSLGFMVNFFFPFLQIMLDRSKINLTNYFMFVSMTQFTSCLLALTS